jgi:purine-binding chemotaxis protein CheW
MQYLTFRLNGVEYAVDVKIIETVIEYSGSTAVPTALPYMKGVIDLRGQVIPLIDLRKKLGLPSMENEQGASVIVFSVEGDETSGKPLTVGALVDGVSEVISIDEKDIRAAEGRGAELWRRYVSGVIRNEDRMLVMLSAAALFSIEELDALKSA